MVSLFMTTDKNFLKFAFQLLNELKSRALYIFVSPAIIFVLFLPFFYYRYFFNYFQGKSKVVSPKHFKANSLTFYRYFRHVPPRGRALFATYHVTSPNSMTRKNDRGRHVLECWAP